MSATPPHAPKPSSSVSDNEIDFFDRTWGEQNYSPTGARLRMSRDLRRVLRESGGERLGRVLSVGCGDGRFEQMVAARAESVIGVDISPVAIEGARKAAAERGLGNLRFLCGSVLEVDLDHEVDVVLSIGFIHHLPEPDVDPFLENMRRLLAPGGFLYAQEPNVHGILRSVGRRVLGSRYDDYHSPDERELDPDETRRALLRAGFAEVEIEPIDLTLVPASYALVRSPAWIHHLCDRVDRVFSAAPLPTRWASGFAAIGRTPAGA